MRVTGSQLKDVILACLPGDDAETSGRRQELFLAQRARLRKSDVESIAERAWDAVRDDVVRLAPLKAEHVEKEIFDLFEHTLGR